MLMEHETSKLKDLDEEYATELREWKAQLKPRKQVMNESQRDSQCLSHLSMEVTVDIGYTSRTVCTRNRI